MESLLLGVLIVLMVALLILLYLQLRRTQGAVDLSTPLQNLTQAVLSGQAQTAVLAEKLSRLEPLPRVIAEAQLDLRGLAERLSTVERNQGAASQSLQSLGTGLAQTSVATRSLVETASAIQSELSRAKEGLAELQAHARARQEVELRTAESIRRLEAVIAGTQARGAAGENILDVVFARLPPEWQVRDLRVGGKQVEFGLRLPNDLILPIDSKWPATGLVEQFVNCEDPSEQQELKRRIELAVRDKAREVKKYIHPNLTVNFGIAAVPDAVYDLCYGVQAQMFRENVVLVGYSMFVPYLLLVFQTVLKTSQNVDLERLHGYLQAAQGSMKALQDELEGRFSRAITMLTNCRGEMGVHLSRASSGLASLQISASGTLPVPVETPITDDQGTSTPGGLQEGRPIL